MNIKNVSKENRSVVAGLDADDLVLICNALSEKCKKDTRRNEILYRLYKDMMIARDLCQYGHIDNFCMDRIIECHEELKKGFVDEEK